MKRFYTLLLVFVYSISMSGILSSAHACCNGDWEILSCPDEQMSCCSLETEQKGDEEKNCESDHDCECPEVLSALSLLDLAQIVDSEPDAESYKYSSTWVRDNGFETHIHFYVSSGLLTSKESPPISSKAVRLLICSLVLYA